MSECVVRMEMPGCCWDCPCLDDYGDYPRCEITNEQRGYNFPIHEKRMPGCPIMQPLPEGHGDLVDSEEDVSKYITIWDCNCSEFGRQTVMAVEDLQYLPTIVPAERSEKDGR